MMLSKNMRQYWIIFIDLIFQIFSVGSEDIVTAKAYISPSAEQTYPNRIYGAVYMSQQVTGGETRFRVKLAGLNANQKHGFHIHTFGDIHNKERGCQGAGPHYNPFGRKHGGKNSDERHIGDLGNVLADEEGRVDIYFTHDIISLVGEYSITGRSFVVHEKEDDLGKSKIEDKIVESVRNGNSGTRIACGYIYYAANSLILQKLPKQKR